MIMLIFLKHFLFVFAIRLPLKFNFGIKTNLLCKNVRTTATLCPNQMQHDNFVVKNNMSHHYKIVIANQNICGESVQRDFIMGGALQHDATKIETEQLKESIVMFCFSEL